MRNFRVFFSKPIAGTDEVYTTVETYSLARQLVDGAEKQGVKCSIVERILQGKNRGQEWTVYERW